jgi:hypothetical protein
MTVRKCGTRAGEQLSKPLHVPNSFTNDALPLATIATAALSAPALHAVEALLNL